MQCRLCSYSQKKQDSYDFAQHLINAHGIHSKTADYLSDLQIDLDRLKRWKES